MQLIKKVRCNFIHTYCILPFFIMSLLCISCSFPVKNPPPANHDGVDLSLGPELQNSSEHGSNEKLVRIQKGEETVRIGNRGGDIFVPEEKNEPGLVSRGGDLRAMRVGVSFGPGLNRVIGHISLLKFLEKKGIAPSVLTGSGFGAIVAAMYASGMGPEMIEWNFYRYFKEKSRTDLYDINWLKEVEEFLISKVKTKLVQQTTKKFYITLYNPITGKTHYFEKGQMGELLKNNFIFKGNYVSPLLGEIFNPELMQKLGADFTIGSDVLSKEINFQEEADKWEAQYRKAMGNIKSVKKKFDYFFEIPLENMPLDLDENHGNYFLQVDKYLKRVDLAFLTKLRNKRKVMTDQKIEEEQ